jgi:hypothetical protein
MGQDEYAGYPLRGRLETRPSLATTFDYFLLPALISFHDRRILATRRPCQPSTMLWQPGSAPCNRPLSSQ